MTNEEAREILQQIRKQKCVSECDYGCKLYESETFCLEEKALDMAIKALEQQPCEDCISRKAVINTIFYKADNNSDVVLSADLMDRIKHLPSVTPKA